MPYKHTEEQKIAKEAALATGELTDMTPRVVSNRPVTVPRPATVSEDTTADADVEEEIKPLIGEADPEFERLLAEEEEIERSTKSKDDTSPQHFRQGDGD